MSFTTVTPKADNPSPADEDSGVDPSVVLSWTVGVGGSYDHDVYFDTVFEGRQLTGDTTFDPDGDLTFGRRYTWQIDEVDHGTGLVVATGDVWEFWVLNPVCTSPPAGDITGPEDVPDCVVDLYDLAAMASSWLDCGWDYGPWCP